jgi:surface antigen
MNIKTVIAVLCIALFSAGCSQDGTVKKQGVGAVTGGALGGLLGSQFGSGSGQLAATGAGVFLGALIGSEVGRSMDDVDRLKADQANRSAKSAPIGETITWNNPDTGNHGSVKATKDGTSSSGQYCREFQQTVTIGGKTEDAYGTACRQPDSSWQVVQ